MMLHRGLDDKKKLLFLNCACVGRQLYLVSAEYNLLCTLNIDNGDIKIVDSCPEEFYGQISLFGNVLCENNELIFIPLMAKKIWIYNIVGKNWESISLDEKFDDIPFKFFGAIHFGEYIYLFGHYFDGILCLNIRTKKFDVIRITTEKKIQEKGQFLWDYVVKGRQCYIPSLISNQIIILDFDTNKVIYCSVGDERNSYVGLTWDGAYFWLAPRLNGKYVRWDGKDDVVEYNLPKEFKKSDFHFIGAYMDGDKVVFPGMVGKNGTLIFSKESPLKIEIVNEEIMFYKSLDNIFVKQNADGQVVIKEGFKNMVYEMVVDKEKWSRIEEERVVSIFRKMPKEQLYLSESNTNKLKYYIKSLI